MRYLGQVIRLNQNIKPLFPHLENGDGCDCVLNYFRYKVFKPDWIIVSTPWPGTDKSNPLKVFC